MMKRRRTLPRADSEAYVEPERVFDGKEEIYPTREYYQSGSVRISSKEVRNTPTRSFLSCARVQRQRAYAISRRNTATAITAILCEPRRESLYQTKRHVGRRRGKVTEAITILSKATLITFFYKDAMNRSRHLVLIPFAVRPTNASINTAGIPLLLRYGRCLLRRAYVL